LRPGITAIEAELADGDEKKCQADCCQQSERRLVLSMVIFTGHCFLFENDAMPRPEAIAYWAANFLL
jgi:hypothetical protein